MIHGLPKPGQIIFVAVTDPIRPTVETPQTFWNRVVETAEYVPLEFLGTTDDRCFSFCADDNFHITRNSIWQGEERRRNTAMAEQVLGT